MLFSNIDATQGLWFLLPSIPICLWVAYTDLSQMRIPNVAVLALFGTFVVLGPFVMPLEDYGWRYVHMLVVLAIGFVLSATVGVGAGDSKFAAAMAPFVALGDVANYMFLFCVLLLVTFGMHRIIRNIKPITDLMPDWKSWTDKKFPMGITLIAVHLTYLAVAATQ